MCIGRRDRKNSLIAGPEDALANGPLENGLMKRHLGALLGLVLAWGTGTWAIAQSVDLPDNLKSSASLGPAEIQTVDAFVKAQMQRLIKGDSAAQSGARDTLINQATLRGKPSEAAFLDAYAAALNQSIQEQISADTPLRVRLNAAIVTARIAEMASNTRLADATLRWLGDKESPVVLWGMKAARYVLPPMLDNEPLAQRVKLPQAIVQAVERTKSGPVLQEAYSALSLGVFNSGTSVVKTNWLNQSLPALFEILGDRVKQYAAGVPSEPQAENLATAMLVHPQVWPKLTAEQRVQAVQAMNDFIVLGASRFAAAANNTPEAESLAAMVSGTAKALWVVGTRMGSSALVELSTRLSKIDARSSGKEAVELAGEVHPLVTAIAEFRNVTPPPKLQAQEASSAPAGGGTGQ